VSKCQVTATPNRRQTGLTLVELMVAMVIGLLITLAAVTTLTVSKQGFTTVDAASQLRDNGRFAADLIQRLGVQSGFKDAWYAGRYSDSNADVAPSIYGFNNSLPSASDPLNDSIARTTPDGSDVLILRNQLVKLNSDPNNNDADGSMIDCMGNAKTTDSAPINRNDRDSSILSVDISRGEPSLMCTTINKVTGVPSTQPIVRGVEVFQVLYGTEGVTANTAPPVTYTRTAGAPAPTASDAWKEWEAHLDQAPDKYLRADQLTVPGDTISTNANWRRVRSLRIGMILRGAPNSAQNSVATDLYPFGLAKSSGSGDKGSAMYATDDTGAKFHAPADGRLRQVVTFTVHLRNSQGL
jgi:type IV pilus assembly protein PilW